MNHKRLRTSYVISILLLLLIIISAFFLPSEVMSWQDDRLMQEAKYEHRPGLYDTIMYGEYEMDLQKRLSAFAAGSGSGQRYTAYASDYSDGLDDGELLDRVRMILEEFGIWIEYFPDLDELLDCREEYYIIYDSETLQTAAFICQVLEISLSPDSTLRLTIDGKDNTLYYLEAVNLPDYMEESFSWMQYPEFMYLCFEYYQSTEANIMLESIMKESTMRSGRNMVYGEIQSEQIQYNADSLTLFMQYSIFSNVKEEGAGFDVSVGLKEINDLIKMMQF